MAIVTPTAVRSWSCRERSWLVRRSGWSADLERVGIRDAAAAGPTEPVNLGPLSPSITAAHLRRRTASKPPRPADRRHVRSKLSLSAPLHRVPGQVGPAGYAANARGPAITRNATDGAAIRVGDASCNDCATALRRSNRACPAAPRSRRPDYSATTPARARLPRWRRAAQQQRPGRQLFSLASLALRQQPIISGLEILR